jgi:hypothetical protein
MQVPFVWPLNYLKFRLGFAAKLIIPNWLCPSAFKFLLLPPVVLD